MSVLSDLGFGSGKCKSMYGREGHLGITVVKFASDQSGLIDAVRLAEYFEKENRGRKAWSHLQPLTLGKDDDDKNPNLVKVDERNGEKKRIFYGYLGTVADLDKVDFDMRNKVVIESRREHKGPRKGGKETICEEHVKQKLIPNEMQSPGGEKTMLDIRCLKLLQ
ncbi:hypothetical protein Golob_014767, partial [Gossypium lobatum]|nr:hypothetical protein [Gossypium lobatum]